MSHLLALKLFRKHLLLCPDEEGELPNDPFNIHTSFYGQATTFEVWGMLTDPTFLAKISQGYSHPEDVHRVYTFPSWLDYKTIVATSLLLVRQAWVFHHWFERKARFLSMQKFHCQKLKVLVECAPGAHPIRQCWEPRAI
jgi:hypothetical protein